MLLRCLGRADRSSRGCRRQVTRRRTASCGGARGGRSEDTAELSDGTRRGTRRRSRHTCAKKQDTTQDLDQDLTVPVSVGLGGRYIQAARQEFSTDVSGTSSDMFGLGNHSCESKFQTSVTVL